MWLRIYYFLRLIGGVFSIMDRLPVNICVVSDVDSVVVSSITENYVELGNFFYCHLSSCRCWRGLLCRNCSLLRCNYCVFVLVHCVAWRKYSISH